MTNQITTFLDPAQMPARTQDQQTFDNFMALVMQLLPTWGAEVNAALANFNYLMAGGVYGISYTFDATTTDADPGSGKLRLSSATQNASTVLRLDPLNSGAQDFTSIIDTFDASSSLIKGSIRVVKQGDLTKWLTFDVTARAAPTGYRNLTVVNTGGSAASPFTNNDAVLLFFQRNGDKGDIGVTTQLLHVRDEKATGTQGGDSIAGTQDRTLNTVVTNSISGASLTGNQVTLPAGTYDFEIAAPSYGVSQHRALLYNVTDAAVVHVGTPENCATASNSTSSHSFVTGRMTLAAQKVFKVQHYTAGAVANGLGLTLGDGRVGVFTRARFWKVQ